MHEDLRRRALESSKTVSNKAKSKQSSRASSRPTSQQNSRPSSRVQSRDVSDDEEGGGNLSDETSHSINSIDELLASDDFNEQATDTLKQELHDRIAELIDRKGSSNKGRIECLASYVKILTAHHIADELYGKISELISSFGRSIKIETSEKEVLLALKALSLTSISLEDQTLYENVGPLLKRIISDSQSFPTKAAAIYCFGDCITFGGAGEEEISDALTFLLEIASSDGNFVDAADDAQTVTAALQVYGFLATQVEDLEAESEDAIEAFMEQLDSGDSDVQIAAGENIALLYEKSYTPAEEDDASSELDENEGDSDDDALGDPALIKRYEAYHNTKEVLEKISALASLSTQKLSKRAKKQVHQSFTSILMTVENPRIGLQTNNASRMTVRIHQTGEMKVDRWWKFMRLNALRRLLAGGFVNHYFEGNEQVLDVLPLIMRETGVKDDRASKLNKNHSPNKSTKGRWNQSRRFVS